MVISTLQQQTIARVSTTQGHAISVGEERKMAAQAEACCSVGMSFNHLVVESIGGWSDQAVNTIRSFGRLLGQKLGITPADSTTHLFQRLTICLWMEICLLFLSCFISYNWGKITYNYTRNIKRQKVYVTLHCMECYNCNSCNLIGLTRFWRVGTSA